MGRAGNGGAGYGIDFRLVNTRKNEMKKMYMTALMALGILSISTAGVLAQLPPATQLKEIGEWPVTIALIALAALSVYLMYRQAENSRQTSQDLSEALRNLCAELKQRPCIRERGNN